MPSGGAPLLLLQGQRSAAPVCSCYAMHVMTAQEPLDFEHALSVRMHRDELQEYDPFDEGVFCRSRFWLFISYVVSFASVAGSVWVLLGHYALNPDVPTVWPGIAGLFQVPSPSLVHQY